MRFDITKDHIKKLKSKDIKTQEDAITEVRKGLQSSQEENYHKTQLRFLMDCLLDGDYFDKAIVREYLIVAKIYVGITNEFQACKINIIRFLMNHLSDSDFPARFSAWVALLDKKEFFQLMTDDFSIADEKQGTPIHLVGKLNTLTVYVSQDNNWDREKALWAACWRGFDDLFQRQMLNSPAFAQFVLNNWYHLARKSSCVAIEKFLSPFNVRENLLTLVKQEEISDPLTTDQKRDEKENHPVKISLTETLLSYMRDNLGCLKYQAACMLITIDQILAITSFEKVTRVLNRLVISKKEFFSYSYYSAGRESYKKYLEQAKEKAYQGLSDPLMLQLAYRNPTVLGALLTLPARSSVFGHKDFHCVILFYFQPQVDWYSSFHYVRELINLSHDEKIALINFIFSPNFTQENFEKVVNNDFFTFIDFIEMLFLNEGDFAALSNPVLSWFLRKMDDIPCVQQRFLKDMPLYQRAIAAMGLTVSEKLIMQVQTAQDDLKVAQSELAQAKEALAKLQEALQKKEAEVSDLTTKNTQLSQCRSTSSMVFFPYVPPSSSPRKARLDVSDNKEESTTWVVSKQSGNELHTVKIYSQAHHSDEEEQEESSNLSDVSNKFPLIPNPDESQEATADALGIS